MKKVVFLIFTCMVFTTSYGQQIAVQIDKQNILYMGIENPLTVVVAECPLPNLSLTTDNGEIRNISPNQFVIKPKYLGNSTIEISKKSSKGMEKLRTMYFRVKRMEAQLSLGGYADDEIPKNLLVAQIAPSATVCCIDIDAHYTINHLSVIIKRDNKIIFSKELRDALGVRFDEETKNFFKQTQIGDVLFIKDVTCKDFDNSDRKLMDIKLTVGRDKHSPEDDNEYITDPISGVKAKKH